MDFRSCIELPFHCACAWFALPECVLGVHLFWDDIGTVPINRNEQLHQNSVAFWIVFGDFFLPFSRFSSVCLSLLLKTIFLIKVNILNRR